MTLKYRREEVTPLKRTSHFHSGSQPCVTAALAVFAWCWLFMVLGGGGALAQTSIPVPNASFESQVAGPPFGVDTRVDSWQKPDKPDYFDEVAFGFLWDQTAGMFLDTNPYGNSDGAQVGYVLSFPQAALFQDYDSVDWNDSTPTHDFDAVFEPGNSYQLTLGVFGKDMVEGATLELSLYYRDALDNMVTVGSTPVVYSAATFPEVPPLNLIDYSVTVSTVQASDEWAGKNIGIKIESTFGSGAGYWDIDNVRLTAVPEPASLGLMSVLLGGLLLRRHRVGRAS